MSIEKDLKNEGIKVIEKIDSLISLTVLKNVARRIVETFPDYELTEKSLVERFSELTLYKAKMIEGMSEASYFYKNASIYFNEDIEYEDLEEFSIHECIHFLQELKDEKNNLLRMGLCTYIKNKPLSLAINEAAVQYTASHIIGIEPDFEKYYNITLFTPSPSYYPLECSLLNEILYFTNDEVLFRSTLFSSDDFKNKVIEMTSEKTYLKIQSLFDKILKLEEHVIILNNKILTLEDGNPKFERLTKKVNTLKAKIASSYIQTQNIIIEEFFDYEFRQISNLEDLEKFRHKLYKFSDIIGTVPNYKFFDNYYTEAMNRLEHKCNILENGGTETAISKKSSNPILAFLKKIFDFNNSELKKDI